MRIPKQFYIFAMVLSLYYWPWYLSLFEPDIDALLTVMLLQSALVISCNILVNEQWKYALILIEAFCMFFNVTFFLFPALLLPFHEQLMLWAFIIELLIITISMQGAAIGRSTDHAVPNIGSRIRANYGLAFGMACAKRAYQ